MTDYGAWHESKMREQCRCGAATSYRSCCYWRHFSYLVIAILAAWITWAGVRWTPKALFALLPLIATMALAMLWFDRRRARLAAANPMVGEGEWNPAVEEKYWRSSMERSQPVLDQFDANRKPGVPQSDFYVLCLAETDAGVRFTRPESFTSRETFIAELKRLMREPTQPSRPVPSIEYYESCQKWWLEFVVKRYDIAPHQNEAKAS